MERTILDRENLSIKKFWKEFKKAKNNISPVLILTHKKNVEELPEDIKYLIKESHKAYQMNAIQGLTAREIKLIIDTLKLVFIFIFLMSTSIFMIHKNYKFKFKKNDNGDIEIECDPK